MSYFSGGNDEGRVISVILLVLTSSNEPTHHFHPIAHCHKDRSSGFIVSQVQRNGIKLYGYYLFDYIGVNYGEISV